MTQFLTTWPPELYQWAGIFGFMLYVINYTLITLRRVHSDQVRFFVLNWAASSLVLVGLVDAFNLAAALIQVFWILVSTLGIVIRLRRPRRRTLVERQNTAPAEFQHRPAA